MWKDILWEDVKQDESITAIEHPLYLSTLNKKQFEEEFGPILELLNGETMSDYMDFFFENDIINPSCLKFIDEDAKADFYDWGVELGCLLSLKETHEGETAQAKQQRKEEEKVKEEQKQNNVRAQEIQRQKIKEKEAKQQLGHKDKMRLVSMKKSIDKKPASSKKDKAIHYLQTEYEKYKNKYNKIIDTIEGI